MKVITTTDCTTPWVGSIFQGRIIHSILLHLEESSSETETETSTREIYVNPENAKNSNNPMYFE